MRAYDPTQPLIMLHIPKTGGTSVRQVFRQWFGVGFFEHYFNESRGEMPARHDLAGAQQAGRAVVVYGHFNHHRGFGAADYYPEVKQFVTIVRDPFERAVSLYFYVRQQAHRGAAWWKSSEPATLSLREFLAQKKEGPLGTFGPIPLTLNNYQEVVETLFVEVGILEMLDESMRRIATSLHMNYDTSMLSVENGSLRDQEVPYDLRDSFMDRHPLEYAFYNYVARKFNRSSGPTDDGPIR